MLKSQVVTFLVIVAISGVGIFVLACLYVSVEQRTHRHLPPSDSEKP